MISDERRREVAENLRHLTIGHFIQYKEQFFDELAEVVVGFEDFHDFNVVLEKLADLIDPEGPTVTSDECDTRIPYRLGTDSYCKFKGRDEYVHMGDLVAVYQGADGDGTLPYFGYLFGVNYDATGSICDVTLRTIYESRDFCVACDGAFYCATEVADD